MGRRAFADFIQIKNLRKGAQVEGKTISVYFDIIIGSFTLYGASWHEKSGSIRLNAGRHFRVKGSYVKTLRIKVVEAVKEYARAQIERANESAN